MIETFDPERRPIVEFALDNVQTLRLRKNKLQSQQATNSNTPDDMIMDEQESAASHKTDDHPKRKDKKKLTKHRGTSTLSEAAEPSKGEETEELRDRQINARADSMARSAFKKHKNTDANRGKAKSAAKVEPQQIRKQLDSEVKV